MKPLLLKKDIDTPHIIFDKQNNQFEIEGRSLPENVVKFYTPVITWLEEYKKNPNPKTIFKFKFEYFNTTSSKKVLDILSILEEIKDASHDVQVIWYYEKCDKEMRDAGQEYSEMIELPFEILEFNP